MERWRREWFRDRYHRGRQTIFLTNHYGRSGILTYVGPLPNGEGQFQLAVASWEHAVGRGLRIWRSKVAMLSPQAGVPDELSLIAILSAFSSAFEECNKWRIEILP